MKIMKKMKTIKLNLTLTFIWLFTFPTFAQVGINTLTPQSTLDVSADNSNIAPGVIAPRQTLQQLITKASSYTVNQKGAIVYVTDISGGSSVATANITEVGYYYYDGSLWQPFTNSSAVSADSWLTIGNSGLSVTHGTNYLGTNDAVDLVLKTNGTERMTISSTGNVGIGTDTPSNKLHVKDATNPMKIEGLEASGSTDDRPMVITPDGVVKTGIFPVVNLVPDDVGTVIAIDGKLLVAQEITALMTADFSFSVSPTVPPRIGNLTNVIVDNKNSFVSNSTTNSFSVEADGVYLVTMNVQISSTGKPVIGIWCDTPEASYPNGRWVARVNDEMGSTLTLQTFTLITAINMYASKIYSFRVAGAASGTIPWRSSGFTGEGPISFYSVKRLR